MSEALDVVKELNSYTEDLYAAITKLEAPFSGVVYESDGYNELIKYLDVRIWCSVDDCRPCNEDTGDAISLKSHILNKINNINSTLVKFLKKRVV